MKALRAETRNDDCSDTTLFRPPHSKMRAMPRQEHSMSYRGLIGEEEPRDDGKPGTQQFRSVSRDRRAHERQQGSKYRDKARGGRWRFLEQPVQA